MKDLTDHPYTLSDYALLIGLGMNNTERVLCMVPAIISSYKAPGLIPLSSQMASALVPSPLLILPVPENLTGKISNGEKLHHLIGANTPAVGVSTLWTPCTLFFQ